eukprot:TRINITY_DN1709_c1_g2_i1.p1 TRINITY_DN1709_c1_g2~~TRINITY_DN1709_c1_g2_i1.p1  ORF type:complete len:600 (+),score=182.93 TRINITY_DN1709_c1_g2_i1:78-1802(+)
MGCGASASSSGKAAPAQQQGGRQQSEREPTPQPAVAEQPGAEQDSSKQQREVSAVEPASASAMGSAASDVLVLSAEPSQITRRDTDSAMSQPSMFQPSHCESWTEQTGPQPRTTHSGNSGDNNLRSPSQQKLTQRRRSSRQVARRVVVSDSRRPLSPRPPDVSDNTSEGGGMPGRLRSVDLMTDGGTSDYSEDSVASSPPMRQRLPGCGEVLGQERAGMEVELVDEAVADHSDALELEHCEMTILPERARMMSPTIVTAQLGHNQLTTLPSWVADWTLLTVLSVPHNSITSLPDTIGELKLLQRLDASHNQLARLPSSVAGLEKLAVCTLDFNGLLAFPDELLQPKGIQQIHMAENHLVSTLPNLELLRRVRVKVYLDNIPSLYKRYADEYKGNTEASEVIWNKIYPDCVCENLYIGSLRSAQTPKVYTDLGIKFVVTCGKNMKICKEGDVEQREVLVEDVEEQSLVPYFESTTEWMHGALPRGGVLVHCFAGLSRSATFTIAYLMRKKGLRLDDAIEEVMRARPAIHPNPAFMRELVQYDAQLFGVPPAVRPLDMTHIGEGRSERRMREAGAK